MIISIIITAIISFVAGAYLTHIAMQKKVDKFEEKAEFYKGKYLKFQQDTYWKVKANA